MSGSALGKEGCSRFLYRPGEKPAQREFCTKDLQGRTNKFKIGKLLEDNAFHKKRPKVVFR